MQYFPELNRGKCKTYLIGCEHTRKAVLIDPVRENISRYLAFLAYQQLKLEAIVYTHTHADHPTGSFQLRDLTQARLVMHRRAPVPAVDQHVEQGDRIVFGDTSLQVLYTPGHTPDSISLYTGERWFTPRTTTAAITSPPSARRKRRIRALPGARESSMWH